MLMALDKGGIMIIDRYTKVVFTLIAISLFVISLNPWIAPTKAYAEWDHNSDELLQTGFSKIAKAIKSIDCSR